MYVCLYEWEKESLCNSRLWINDKVMSYTQNQTYAHSWISILKANRRTRRAFLSSSDEDSKYMYCRLPGKDLWLKMPSPPPQPSHAIPTSLPFLSLKAVSRVHSAALPSISHLEHKTINWRLASSRDVNAHSNASLDYFPYIAVFHKHRKRVCERKRAWIRVYLNNLIYFIVCNDEWRSPKWFPGVISSLLAQSIRCSREWRATHTLYDLLYQSVSQSVRHTLHLTVC